MKATTLLRQQHRKTLTALKKLEKRHDGELLEEISNDLAGHMAIEQEIFYPFIRDLDEDMVLESYEEHALAELALRRLRATEPDSEAFSPRVTALRELLEHHIEEEQDDLFPKVEKKIGAAELNRLGQRMETRFEDVVRKGFDEAVPNGWDKTSADLNRDQAEVTDGHADEAVIH